MELEPGVLNTFFILSLLRNYKGTVRNLIFILLFWGLSYYFGSYLFQQADKYYDNASVTTPNIFFGYLLFSVLLLDFLAYFVKFKTIKYHVFKNRDVFQARMGLLSMAESLMIGISIACNLVPSIWIMKIILHALPPADPIYTITVLLVLTKWGTLGYKCMFMTPNSKDGWMEEPPDPPSKTVDRIADITLTITSSILFTVIWQLGVTRFFTWYHPFDFQTAVYTTVIKYCVSIFALSIFSIILYMPTRLIFIMEDYYALTEQKYRRTAFYSSVLAVLVSVVMVIVQVY